MINCFITRIKNELHELLFYIPINQGGNSCIAWPFTLNLIVAFFQEKRVMLLKDKKPARILYSLAQPVNSLPIKNILIKKILAFALPVLAVR
jgi:hypothetical protein